MDVATLLLSWAQTHWYDIITSLLAAGAIAKYVRIRAIAGEFFDLVHEVVGAKANGQITDAEYAIIGKKTVPLVDSLWAVVKGLFPNKSKV